MTGKTTVKKTVRKATKKADPVRSSASSSHKSKSSLTPAASESEVQLIRFTHEIHPETPLLPATGAIGSVTPVGTLVAYFFVEHAYVHTENLHELKNGALGQRIPEPGEMPHMIRRFTTGLHLDYASAVRVRDWLSQRVEEMGKAFGATQVSSDTKSGVSE